MILKEITLSLSHSHTHTRSLPPSLSLSLSRSLDESPEARPEPKSLVNSNKFSAWLKHLLPRFSSSSFIGKASTLYSHLSFNYFKARSFA